MIPVHLKRLTLSHMEQYTLVVPCPKDPDPAGEMARQVRVLLPTLNICPGPWNPQWKEGIASPNLSSDHKPAHMARACCTHKKDRKPSMSILASSC